MWSLHGFWNLRELGRVCTQVRRLLCMLYGMCTILQAAGGEEVAMERVDEVVRRLLCLGVVNWFVSASRP